MKTLVESQRSLGGALGGFFIAAGLAAVTTTLATDSGLPKEAALGVWLVGGLFVGAFLSLAFRLWVWRGGIVHNTREGRIGFGLTGPSDTWWFPRHELRGIASVEAEVQRDGERFRTWSVQIETKHGAPISLLETPDPDAAEMALEALTALGVLKGAPPTEGHRAPLANRRVRFGVHRRGALGQPVFLFGLSLLVMGSTFFVQLNHFPVFGLFFAPPLALVGFILVSLVLLKRFGHELLQHTDGAWTHSTRCGPLTLYQRTLHAQHPRWRIRLHALRGASLELVADDGILLMASGATTLSHLSVSELALLPDQFASLRSDESPGLPTPTS